MVIVRLIGGLGNQMFQYAAGRRLAHNLAVELKLDIAELQDCILRKYSIGNFNIQENFASPEEVATLRVQKCGIVRRVLTRVLCRSSHIREKHLHFDSGILKLPDNVYIDGYWQSEKYFVDIAAIIRDEFTIKTPEGDENKELANQMASVEAVSLHVRRQDYFYNSDTNQFQGTCDLAYYYRCVKCLSSRVKNPHFFIFSDDPKWARDNLKLPYPTTFVVHNGADKDYEDLRLMARNKYHIIANSTFSWWGAWLCTNPAKVVIAPKQWFAKPGLDTRDLIPKTWSKI